MGSKLKVGIDIRDLKVAKTGARTYLEEIMKALQARSEDCELVLLDSSFSVYSGRNKFLKAIEHLRFFAWKQIILPVKAWRRHCDILYCTDYFVPFIHLGYKPIPLFHDAFFYEYPEQVNPLWLKMFKLIGVGAARKAPCIITISEYSKNRLSELTGIPAERFIPIYHAAKQSVAKPQEDDSFIPPAPKYFLHVGVMEKRKNLVRLIEAFQILQERGFTEHALVLVGLPSYKDELDASTDIRAAIRQYGLEDKVITPGYVSDQELALYYKHAAAYVFPSLNEGFGLPVLEAFHHRLPVIVAGNSCLPEIGGDAVLSCDPYSPEDIADQMVRMITDPALREELLKRSAERSKLFTWERSAEQLLAVFKRVTNKQ